MRKNGLLWKKPTTVGTYKGNLVVVRKINKKSVDLNRNILKELNAVSTTPKVITMHAFAEPLNVYVGHL